MIRCSNQDCSNRALWQDADGLQWCSDHTHSMVSRITPNVEPCHCCNQLRPYPTEPGIWEYLLNPTLTKASGETYYKWVRVTVVPSIDGEEDALNIIPNGATEPTWWPSNCQWRQVEEANK